MKMKIVDKKDIKKCKKCENDFSNDKIHKISRMHTVNRRDRYNFI